MASFVELNSDNIVIRGVAVNNDVINNLPFPQSEPVGIAFCQSLYGSNTKWAQTSYNSSFRYNYASIGYTYDEIVNAFIPPNPYPSWILDTTVYQWRAPKPYPNDGKSYGWDEAIQSWVEI
jgi:hypothetical protein